LKPTFECHVMPHRFLNLYLQVAFGTCYKIVDAI